MESLIYLTTNLCAKLYRKWSYRSVNANASGHVFGILNLPISTIFLLGFWNCSDSVIFFFPFYYRLCKNNYDDVPLTSLNNWVKIAIKDGCSLSSVIKIVKMKYHRIDIKWWLVTTSFKLHLEIIVTFYITFTIFYYKTSGTWSFYYNTISVRFTFFPVPVKDLFQTESYNLHVMQI